MKIIPAIDIIEGKCVRLTQGDYAQKKVYNEKPVDVAMSFEQAGLKYLHLVDLDGAKAGKVINWDTVKAVASKTKLVVDFGGGIKTESEIQKLLDFGVAQVNLGSVAVKHPELVQQWLKKFGPEKIILSADVKDEIVQISGWQEKTSLTITEFVTDYQNHGIQFVTCTDISTDGMLTGPNIVLYKKLVSLFPSIKWIASGGVSSTDDIYELKNNGLSGAIIGKAIYENKINLSDLNLVSIRK
jgi:phosphoribosylformimino-5-aminoimidazole carboxamide ribotide isomerase